MNIIAGLIAVLAMSGFSAAADISLEKAQQEILKRFPKTKFMSSETYKKSDQDKIILVDVRSAEEREVSTLPGALSRSQFEKQMHLYKKGYKILSYCTLGGRAARFNHGITKDFPDSYVLSGSLLGWIASGGDLVTAAGKPTKKVAIPSSYKKLVPKGYERVEP